jgi:uncharacterized RDD family membrane protein YckC
MAGEWYVGKNGQQSGPFTSRQLRQMAADGQLSPTDLLWKEGMNDWAPCSSIKGLLAESSPASSSLPRRPSPRPTAPPPRPAAPISTAGQTDSTYAGDIRDTELAIDLQPDSSQPAAALQYASFLPRVGAFLLDGLFAGLIACIPSIGIVFVIMSMAHDSPEREQAALAVSSCCVQLVYQVVALVYYVTAETSAKQGTWGKQIVGIKVTDIHGKRITVGRAIARHFAKMLTGLTFGIGILMPLFTEKKQTLHDMIAGCLALKK